MKPKVEHALVSLGYKILSDSILIKYIGGVIFVIQPSENGLYLITFIYNWDKGYYVKFSKTYIHLPEQWDFISIVEEILENENSDLRKLCECSSDKIALNGIISFPEDVWKLLDQDTYVHDVIDNTEKALSDKNIPEIKKGIKCLESLIDPTCIYLVKLRAICNRIEIVGK